jgi:gamma-glutamyltranspeptidase/glutathione hydrolase
VPRFRRWAVCSPLTLASEVGRDVLRDGGNAVDAAIATNLVLAVAYPHMCGVGGDLLAQVWDRGALVGLNASGALPAAAVLPEDGTVPEHGIGSATVPGAPSGWCALADRFGTRSLRALAEPAIRLARRGVPRSPGLARMTAWWRSRLEADPEAARIFLAEGDLVQEELADVLADLPGFYHGPVAAAAPAPFTPEDFAAHAAEWVEPLRTPLGDAEVCELPHNSRGHLVLEAIRRLAPLDGLRPDDPEFHARQMAALEPVVRGGDTIYLTVVDGDGMAVSLNQSLFRPFGSGVVVPGTGVLLHNRGAFHTPATYRGGGKPIHTLAPGMALRDGRPLLVFGTMGGEGQVQIHLQLLARILVAGQDPQDAVAAPRWLLEPDVLLVEDGLPPLADVAPTGVSILPMAVPDLAGHAHAIRITGDGLLAGCDPRADGVAVGD